MVDSLAPKPWYALNFRVHDSSGQSIPSRVALNCDFPETISMPAGSSDQQEPLDTYGYAVTPETGDLIGHWGGLYLDHNTTVDVALVPGQQRFAEDFSNNMTNWTHGGAGDSWRIETDTSAMGFGPCLSTTHPF